MYKRKTRGNNELRDIRITPGFIGSADGSVLIEWGRTRVICTAVLDPNPPSFKIGTGSGWVTAEYAMLPASTGRRKRRETLRPDGRSTEIRRLIGRSLRGAVDYKAIGERTIWLDCDVIEADGGTRTASITGAWLALALAAKKWTKEGVMDKNPVIKQVAAVSVGLVDDTVLLDLEYIEDSRAQVDMNIIMSHGEYIEVQGTGEGRAYSRDELNALLDMANEGITVLCKLQNEVLK